MNNLHTKTLNHSKFKIKYHIIFSTKYRKKFLNKIKNDLFNSFKRAEQMNYDKWNIELMNIDKDKPDHIHFIINATPYISVSEIIHSLKQISTYDMWKINNNYLSNYYWSDKHYLWTRGYFCCSIGDASIETIRNYITNQGN